ncbi:sensor histidine kinase [Uliginosibacterium aquaticum]|uniref:histidine kinase n=1 Tax=Uliginosibacterium aquaticum TaxID=2731212 RepID=A0ABX2IQW8_9RHOO|nr:HAMP domain-containing sensor histidine kinase [Uliginosibacterium aquaticum]NSL56535.1 HAMP domain-containing histidine kinase [Uliginosibacterium aquaticum]
MPVPEAPQSTVWLLSLQGELSMHIGTSLDMGEMLRSFLVATTQRLQLRTAQIWWRAEQGELEQHAYPACSVVQWAQDALRTAQLEGFLRDVDRHRAVLGLAGPGQIQALRIGAAAALYLEQSEIELNPAALAVLETLMPRLALACQACMDHRRSRALLELTRLQNRELDAARERAESAWRSKSEFLAAISHEMRTPLNSILGFSELLQLELRDGETADYAASIHAAGRHLHAMFNDLLDLAKLDARRLVLHPEDVDLAQLCAEVWTPHSIAAQRKGLLSGLFLDQKLPVRIVVDPVRLRQVINNLLANALKFTQRGKVEMHVMPSDGLIAFAVVDTGPGIQPEARERVFERFCQAGSGEGNRNAEGTGLGLAISRELAEQMGGFISLDSTLGVGTVFTLMLPPVDPGLMRETR